MLKNNQEFKKVVSQKLDEVSSKMLLPDPIIIERKPEEEEKEIGVGMPSEGEIRIIDGKQYLVHKVLEYDSLPRLTLKYNVTQKVLMNCNGLAND